MVKQNLLDKGTALNLDIVTTELLSIDDCMERKHNIEETEKQKAEQLVLFAKSPSSGGMSGGFSGRKKSKKVKSKSKLRPADISCYTCGKKGHWIPECSKKRENKAKQAKSGRFAHVAIESSRNWKVRKMLITIGNGHKIRQVNMASIINTVNSILLDYTATFHMFSEQHLFSLYHSLTNDEYITVSRHYHIPVAGIGSVTLTIILSNNTSKLTFTNTLHIPTLEADLISLRVLHHKDTLVQSWEKGLIISKDGDDLFSAILSSSTGTLYQVQYTDFNCRSAYISASTFSIHLWYCRMKHLSHCIIDSIIHQKAIHELNVFAPKEYNHLYNRYTNSKSHYLPLPGSSAS